MAEKIPVFITLISWKRRTRRERKRPDAKPWYPTRLQYSVPRQQGRPKTRQNLEKQPCYGPWSQAITNMESQLERVRRHVESGRAIISRQRQFIATMRERGGDTTQAEYLLRSFEKTQKLFESDLEEMIQKAAT